MTSDEAEIRKFLADRGVTKCPPAAAGVLGESTPGWRRNAERQAERRKGKSASKTHRSGNSAGRPLKPFFEPFPFHCLLGSARLAQRLDLLIYQSKMGLLPARGRGDVVLHQSEIFGRQSVNRVDAGPVLRHGVRRHPREVVEMPTAIRIPQ